jgi:hypothetical protein
LSKFASGSDAGAKTWLMAAETMKVEEFKVYVEQRGMLQPGEASGGTITIHCNQAVYGQWKEFCNDGRVHSVVGSRDYGRILEAMIGECYQEWIAKFEERRARQEPAVQLQA